ncbi:MAG: DUF4333 domain-containing protein [Leptolyngbyaceae cyanobacterium RU_5_1]|nr:DUF4333 domain-containing protein [Leptolyngbyaceae cyanobacterium RU_5_1]
MQSVDCPITIEQKPGKTYECQVTSDVGAFTVVVEPTGTGEQFRWGTKGLLLLSKLDEFIQRSAQSQGVGKVTVDCGGKVRPAKPGDTFECKVTDAKGRLRSTKVTVRDELGNVYISPL